MRETNLLTPAFASCSELVACSWNSFGRRGANRPVADDEGRDVQPHSGPEECGHRNHGDKHLLRLMKELVAAENGVRSNRRGR